MMLGRVVNQRLSELDAKTDHDLGSGEPPGNVDGSRRRFERALGDRRGELTDERQRLVDWPRSLLAERRASLVLEQRSRRSRASAPPRRRSGCAGSASRRSWPSATPSDLARGNASGAHAALGKELEDVRGGIGTLEAGTARSTTAMRPSACSCRARRDSQGGESLVGRRVVSRARRAYAP